MKINKITIAILLIIIISGVIVLAKNITRISRVSNNDNIIQTDEITIVKLSSLQNGDYSPKDIKVKLGTKVRIEADTNTLQGPMGKLIIDGYDLSKEISPSNNVLEFVADKSGKFRIHCENNMGNGTLIVYEK
ncbi:MAG: cupredoxin domain-containing protein [Microgenomates group bacterium]